ncbi:amino acid permease [Actinospica robiniae]|uniref:amino acid permease n=1 Tax=Actinospica robiniae TaxID=304901 RepID=UPI00041A7D7E|nr:amino acid permease [Actinospica robiniae]
MTFDVQGTAEARRSLSEDEEQLHRMGYPRSLLRTMSKFDNFAISFTIISVLTGCMTMLGYGLNTGGPAEILWGWLIVGGMTTLVGLAMAELASKYPTTGALYYWSAKLAKRNAARWSWYTGWLNVIGQVGGTAGIDYGLAVFVQALIALQWSFTATPGTTFGIYTLVLVVHGLLNSKATRLVALLNRVSVWWHVLGVLLIVGCLLFLPAQHQSVGYVLTATFNNTGFTRFWYVAAIGLLVGGYTFCGFDASAHVSEETRDAAKGAPSGIVRSIVVSWVVGFVLLAGFMLALHHYSAEATATVPPLQIMIDALGANTAKLLMIVIIVAQFFCGMSSVTANSRLIFALSRDEVLPGSRWWFKTTTKTKTPIGAVWLATGVAFLLALPSLKSSVAFYAITSVNVIGLFTAYAIPIFLRLRVGRDFTPGPFSLGRYSALIGRIAIGWIAFETVLFVCPEAAPVTWHNLNYAGFAVLAVLVLATVWWLVTARRSFSGPKSFGTPEELAAMEGELV